jgi:hypothetical protein
MLEKIAFCILFFFILYILFLFVNQFLTKRKFKMEFFSNEEGDKYQDLYPTKGLQDECKKNNLYPSFMPKACYINGELNNYANCKCEDSRGECQICYDTIKKDTENASVIYNDSINAPLNTPK